MYVVLIIVALLFGVVGLFGLTVATQGVGLIAFGCLFGILARIAQAAKVKQVTD